MYDDMRDAMDYMEADLAEFEISLPAANSSAPAGGPDAVTPVEYNQFGFPVGLKASEPEPEAVTPVEYNEHGFPAGLADTKPDTKSVDPLERNEWGFPNGLAGLDDRYRQVD